MIQTYSYSNPGLTHLHRLAVMVETSDLFERELACQSRPMATVVGRDGKLGGTSIGKLPLAFGQY